MLSSCLQLLFDAGSYSQMEGSPRTVACTQSWLLNVYKKLWDVLTVALLLLLLVLLGPLLFSLPSFVHRQIGNVVIRP